MNYLVTGPAGFIGSHLSESLLNSGHDIIAVDDLSGGFLKNLPESGKMIFVNSKIQDLDNDQFGKIHGIFHLAAQASVPVSIDNFYSSSSNNLNSSLKVFEIARAKKIPVVYASSSAIYGNLPIGDDGSEEYEILSPYALDKITLEKYALLCHQLYGINSIGLRFFNVYGPKQDPKNPYSGVISVFIDRFISKQQVIINGGYQTRDFVYVKDVVASMIKAMEIVSEKQICDFVNIGSGNEITIDSLYEKLVNIFNYEPGIIRMPLPHGDPERSRGTYRKMKSVLGIGHERFKGFEEGLRETVNRCKGGRVEGWYGDTVIR